MFSSLRVMFVYVYMRFIVVAVVVILVFTVLCYCCFVNFTCLTIKKNNLYACVPPCVCVAIDGIGYLRIKN